MPQTETPTYKNVDVAKEKTYSEKLKDPRWQRRRLEVLQRDEFTCQLCGDKVTELHVHHLSYQFGNDPWEYPLSNLITYCRHCHTSVEYLNKNYPYEAIKCQKRFCDNNQAFIVLVLLKSDDKLRVAIASFDLEFNFDIIAILGPNTIRDMASLIQQNSETLKTPLHG